MRLLVVEDDPTISHFLVKGLREDQHLVDLAEDGEAGEARALAGDYDAILLDVMLPAQDGFAVCRRLRAQGVDTPILMVTARDTVRRSRARPRHRRRRLPGQAVRVRRGRGAPARADAPRPHAAACRPCSRPAPSRCDQDAHQAQVAGTPVPLTATEYRLLEFLMRRAGTIVSRDQLAEHVWGGEYDPCSNLADVYVGYLRQEARRHGGGRPDPDHPRPGLHARARQRRDGAPALVPRPSHAPLDDRVRPVAGRRQRCGLPGRARLRAARLRRHPAHARRHRDRLVHRCRRPAAPARTGGRATWATASSPASSSSTTPSTATIVFESAVLRGERVLDAAQFAQRARPDHHGVAVVDLGGRTRPRGHGAHRGTPPRRTSRPSDCSPTNSTACCRGWPGCSASCGCWAWPRRPGSASCSPRARSSPSTRSRRAPRASPPATSTCASTRRASTTRSGA